ncbi:MAG: hypothetical protein C4K47_01790 [Candidatus Thorarchaeota archaeon]|nr:MAG: hypothetical protein C4K47_01790 [Candidatus Thorarchaeota archaeon]
MQWSKRLTTIATVRNVLLGLLLVIVLGVILMAVIQPQMMALSGGLPILDLRLFYTPMDVNQLFAALGDTGRLLYTYHQVVDSFFPATYGITIVLALVRLVNRVSSGPSRLRVIVFVPIFAAMADYAENCLIATQLATFPLLSDGIIMTAAIMTVTKWVLIVISLAALIVLGLVAMRKGKQVHP